MQVIHLPLAFSQDEEHKRACVMVLGFLDGLHLAHQMLITQAVKIASRENLDIAVMTFDPHPRQIIRPSSEPMRYLTPLRHKKDLIGSLGADRLYIIPFDDKIAALSPEDFVIEYLLRLNVSQVVAGFDFRYGHRGAGTMQMLRDAGIGRFQVYEQGEMCRDNVKISSTRIRQLVSEGKVDAVPEHLGRHYELSGKQQSGQIFVVDEPYILPLSGYYLVKISADGHDFCGICHVNQNREIILTNCPGFLGKGEAHFRFLKPWKQLNSAGIVRTRYPANFSQN